ncbi:MAG: hypothetical protein GY851_17400 [bacterium]|nr:hypothetical protein [bacterium]
MAEEAAQTAAKPKPGKKHERLEVVEGMRTLQFALHHDPEPRLAMRVFGVILGLVCVTMGLCALATRAHDLPTSRLVPRILAPLVGLAQLLSIFRTPPSKKRFLDFEPNVLTVGSERGNKKKATRFALSDISNLRFVANWHAAKRRHRATEQTPLPALYPFEVARNAGIVCRYRHKPKALFLNLPKDTAEEMLALVYKRYPKLKPKEDA